MNITIKEIAKKAGVGIATVSRVLNNHKDVKKETREKIFEIIKEYQFKPNITARRLVKGTYSETTIGIALADITLPFFFEVIREIYHNLKEYNYNLLIFNLGKNRGQVFEHIAEEHLAGIIIFGDPAMSEEEKNYLILQGTPYLHLDHHEDGENFVCFDNVHGGILAAKYLISNGCRNILLLGGLDNTQQQSERFSAFEDEFQQTQVNTLNKEFIPLNEEESYKYTYDILKNKKTDGIFYFSDTLAFGGLKAKRELKSDVRIIGYDDITASKYMELSTIRQDSTKIAKMAVKSIIDIIKTQLNNRLIQYKIKPELMDRGS